MTGTGYKLALNLWSAIFVIVALIFVRRIQHAFSLHRLYRIYIDTESILLLVILNVNRAFDRLSKFHLSILSSCTVLHYKPQSLLINPRRGFRFHWDRKISVAWLPILHCSGWYLYQRDQSIDQIEKQDMNCIRNSEEIIIISTLAWYSRALAATKTRRLVIITNSQHRYSIYASRGERFDRFTVVCNLLVIVRTETVG